MGRPWWYQSEPPRRPRRWPRRIVLVVVLVALLGGGAYFLWQFLRDGSGGRAPERVASDRLLSLADLPAGWTTDPTTEKESSVANATELCTKPLAGIPPRADGVAAFRESEFGPFVVHVVGEYGGDGAQRSLAALRGALETCGTWMDTVEGTEETGGIDVELTASAGEFRFRLVGDDTVAYRVDYSGGFLLSATADTVVWRRGNTLSIVILLEVARPDSDFLRALVERADLHIRGRPLPGPTPIPT